EFGYRPFPSAQIARLEQLLDHVWKQYHLKRDALLAHSDIAPSRKQDPGELFPWHDFAQKGFGLWPKFVESAAAPDLYQATRMLADIGYDCGAEYDQRLRFALLAFQRRYQPRSISGNPEPTTLALVKGLWLAWQEYHRA
ncbi:MAG: N-acetylmuramoyl-L-alanine amidase, partial [Alphaproteobacteria bacterium]|nr:N-acetylmuramoyl-L-alanine amidase [Alphaproteobacteria bacterium]